MKITAVEPLDHFRLRLQFDDGSAGVADLSHLAGRGVFQSWQSPGVFEQVGITSVGALEWPGRLTSVLMHFISKSRARQRKRFFPLWAIDSAMPEICHFYGIIIQIYYGDHLPPHFHALYAGQVAKIAVESFEVIDGVIPARALGLVQEWAARHQQELREAFERATALQPPGKIAPLE